MGSCLHTEGNRRPHVSILGALMMLISISREHAPLLEQMELIRLKWMIYYSFVLLGELGELEALVWKSLAEKDRFQRRMKMFLHEAHCFWEETLPVLGMTVFVSRAVCRCRQKLKFVNKYQVDCEGASQRDDIRDILPSLEIYDCSLPIHHFNHNYVI